MTALADIIGRTATASPDAIRTTAHHLATIAGEASTLRGRLIAADPAQWQGEAASRFEQVQKGDLPPDLEKLSRSSDACAAALRAYASDVDEVQQRGRELARARDQAIDEQRAAAASATAAQRDVGAAKTSAGNTTDPASRAAAEKVVVRAKQRLASAIARKGTANESVRSVDLAAARLRAEDEANSRRAASAIEAASDAGISNTMLSALQRHGAPVIEAVAKWVEGVAEVVAMVATAASVVLLAIALAVPPAAPFLGAAAGVAAQIALVAGAVAVVAAVVRYVAQFASPGDTRTLGDKVRGGAAIAIGAAAAVPLKKLGPLGKNLDDRLKAFVSAAGRTDPPRIYMNQRREYQKSILEAGGGAAADGAADVVEPDDRARSDAGGVCRSPHVASSYRATYRYEIGPAYA